MTALTAINLGTIPAGSDGDTVRSAFVKVNNNVTILNTQATLTSASLATARALTSADMGKRIKINISTAATLNWPQASTCAADQVIQLVNAGIGVITLAAATGSGDTVPVVTVLNPGDTATFDTDGVSTWGILASTALTVSAAGAGAVARSLVSKLRDFRVNAADFGAVPGLDIGPAIQRAHDAGATVIEVNAGQFPWLTAVTCTNPIQIIGAGYAESPNPSTGTWFENRQTGFTPLTFSGTNARGSAVRRCAFWESNHPSSVVGWTPAANDYLIKVLNTLGGVEIDDVYMVRVNKGIYSFNSGHFHIKKLRGQIYTNPIQIDSCYDIPAIDYMHIWTFYTSDNNIMAYQQANLDVIWSLRCDGLLLGNIFAFGTRSVIRCDSSAYGVTTKLYANSLCVDFSKYGIWIPSGANNTTVQVANLTTEGEAWPSTGVGIPGGAAVQIDANNCEVQIGSIHTQRYYNSPIVLNGQANRIDFGTVWFELSNQANNGSPLFNLANSAGGTNQVNVAGYIRSDNSNSAPTVNSSTNANLGVSALANKGAGASDEPRLFWGGGNSTLQTISPNTNSDLYLRAWGPAGSTRLQANNSTILRVDSPNPGDSNLLVRSNTGSVSVVMESGSTSAGISFAAKGTGNILMNSPLSVPGYSFSALPSASTYPNCLVRVGDRSNRLVISDSTNWRFMDGTVAV